MLIGSGSLEMGLDENMEKRLQTWEKFWAKCPSKNRLEKSRSWNDPKLFKKSSSSNTINIKNEL